MKRAYIKSPYPTLEQVAKFYGMPLAKAREFWDLPFESKERKRSTRPNGRAKKKSAGRKAGARRR